MRHEFVRPIAPSDLIATGIVYYCTFVIFGFLFSHACANDAIVTSLSILNRCEEYYFLEGMEATSHEFGKLFGHSKCWRSWLSYKEQRAFASDLILHVTNCTTAELLTRWGPPDHRMMLSAEQKSQRVEPPDEDWLYEVGYSTVIVVTVEHGQILRAGLDCITH